MIAAHYALCGLLFVTSPLLAKSVDSWIPKGWKQVTTATGDLNKDGSDDEVVVLEKTDPANLKANDAMGAPVLNLNPRRLLVMFKTAEGYQQQLSRDDLLPSEHNADVPCLADPLLDQGGIAITKGKLIIRLGTWLSCGSYSVTNSSFTFRLEGSRLRLIGYDYQQFSRNSGEIYEESINYLTGKEKKTTGGNEFEESTPTVSWLKLAAMPAFYLDAMALDCIAVDSPACGWARALE